MRIVVSGTHGSGKSTLVSDFVFRHSEFVVLPDPFEMLDETWDGPTVASFAAQLRVSAARLHPEETSGSIVAERGPLDLIADEEGVPLRDVANDMLLDLIGDVGIVAGSVKVAEIVGSRHERRETLEALVRETAG
ncbi:hypothetical protein GCM10009808_14620 [Microbacterium sediminicola]|uniref:AAA domain-containing protein n=1 Tax=Microbacterium sediminicola TaxID=415210 RepID=A0ABP4U3N8_9MICO